MDFLIPLTPAPQDLRRSVWIGWVFDFATDAVIWERTKKPVIADSQQEAETAVWNAALNQFPTITPSTHYVVVYRVGKAPVQGMA